MIPPGFTLLDFLQAATLLFVAVAATVVVLKREPLPQSILMSFYGLLLAVLFVLYQAPDVALSQIAVGTVALPLMILLTLAKIKKQDEAKK